jgi:hypothetical protein
VNAFGSGGADAGLPVHLACRKYTSPLTTQRLPERPDIGTTQRVADVHAESSYVSRMRGRAEIAKRFQRGNKNERLAASLPLSIGSAERFCNALARES